MIAIGVLSIVGIVAGGIGAILTAYVIHFFTQIPNIPKGNISEGIGLVQVLVILGIFQSFKIAYRQFLKNTGGLLNPGPVKIGLIGAIFISMVVSMTSIYASTETELHIAKKDLVAKAKVASYEEASQGIENYVYRKTNKKGLPAYLEFSVRMHPFFLFAVFVSCFVFVWTTMPKGLREIVNIVGQIE